MCVDYIVYKMESKVEALQASQVTTSSARGTMKYYSLVVAAVLFASLVLQLFSGRGEYVTPLTTTTHAQVTTTTHAHTLFVA